MLWNIARATMRICTWHVRVKWQSEVQHLPVVPSILKSSSWFSSLVPRDDIVDIVVVVFQSPSRSCSNKFLLLCFTRAFASSVTGRHPPKSVTLMWPVSVIKIFCIGERTDKNALSITKWSAHPAAYKLMKTHLWFTVCIYETSLVNTPECCCYWTNYKSCRVMVKRAVLSK